MSSHLERALHVRDGARRADAAARAARCAKASLVDGERAPALLGETLPEVRELAALRKEAMHEDDLAQGLRLRLIERARDTLAVDLEADFPHADATAPDGFKRSLAHSTAMRPEKVFRLGKVSVEGDFIAFHPAQPLAFEAERRDVVSVGVAYDYKEFSEDKEETRIRLTAHIDGQKPETFEAVIGDSPALDDSRRGFVSVPIRLPSSGQLKGRFLVETSYASGPWRASAPEPAARDRAEGEFQIHVA